MSGMAPTCAATARVATAQPRRYLGQLCKHFEHKLPVELAETAGRIAFPGGACALTAEAEALTLRAEAGTAEDLARLTEVIARHLVRFAFREELAVEWEVGEG